MTVEPEVPPATLARAERAISERDIASYSTEANDRLRFQIEFAQSALKNLLLVNGGAILAMLTALGNSSMDHDSRGMFWAFLWFGLGLSSGLAAYFGAFYSQLYFYNSALSQSWNAQLETHDLPAKYDAAKPFKRGNSALTGGLIAAACSLLSFIIGSFVALEALL